MKEREPDWLPGVRTLVRPAGGRKKDRKWAIKSTPDVAAFHRSLTARAVTTWEHALRVGERT